MNQNWYEIYRGYTDDELDKEITSLRKSITDANGITSQGAGSASYTRDIGGLEQRLGAATRVRNVRLAGGLSGLGAGSANFSGVRV